MKRTTEENQEKDRVLITDGRRTARHRLVSKMEREPGTGVVSTCPMGRAMVEAICNLTSDVVLSDNAHSGLTGSGILERIDPAEIAMVVCIQECPRDLRKAKGADGHDRAAKPADAEKFMDAMQKLVSDVRHKRACGFEERIRTLLRQLESRMKGLNNDGVLRRIAVKENDRIFFLEVHEIDWIEACGDFVRLHVGRNKYLLEQTLSHLESRLDRSLFLRVHRSTIVNTSSIREMRRFSRGRFLIQMKDNTKLFSSKRLCSHIASYLRALK